MSRGTSGGRWEKLSEHLKFELPRGTLVYAETVTEMKGEHLSTRRSQTIHIIDAAFIGGNEYKTLSKLEGCISC